jgi:tetratricopeptide (TPR) repeat protein
MNSVEPLLAQLGTESDDQVKIALLDALGGACSNALSVTPAKISPEKRKQALDFAVAFLSDENTDKARKGAEVLGKLLEPNGLKPEELEGYFGLLVKRYNQQKEKPNSALCGELLSAMAYLCKQNSVGRDKAVRLFEPLFIEALSDETDFVREKAVDGLINIDKAAALKRLRKYVSDSSEILRKKLIDLAGEVGGKDDLVWLVEKTGSNSESGLAWQAMLKIFDGSDSATLNEWVDRLFSQNNKTRLTDEQKITFLKKAEAKAGAEPKMLGSVIEKLAELYYTTGQFERAAEYLDRCYKSASTSGGKDSILLKLLDASLRASKVDRAAELVGECLVKEDLSPDVLGSLDEFLSKPSGAEPDMVLKALSEVKFPGARPQWQKWLKNRISRLGKGEETEKPKEAAGANKA